MPERKGKKRGLNDSVTALHLTRTTQNVQHVIIVLCTRSELVSSAGRDLYNDLLLYSTSIPTAIKTCTKRNTVSCRTVYNTVLGIIIIIVCAPFGCVRLRRVRARMKDHHVVRELKTFS